MRSRPEIKSPVLVVRGERDPLVPRRWSERAAGMAPEASGVTIPGAGHAVNFSAPEARANEVMKFMERSGGARGMTRVD